MCEIMDAIREGGIEAGLKAGREIGMEAGREKVNLLNQYLAAQNRVADIIRSANEPAYQQKLFEEFNI